MARRGMCLKAFCALTFCAAGMLGQELRTDPIPAGPRPLGIDITRHTVPGTDDHVWVAVANNAGNAVSVFELVGRALVAATTIQNIPAPYAISACRPGAGRASARLRGAGNRILVTSPTEGVVRILQVPEGRVLAVLPVGPEPHSIACVVHEPYIAAVSNAGDNSLTVIDVQNLRIMGRIAEVAAARALHGIAFVNTSQNMPVAWVASTEQDTVTLVDVVGGRVIARVPVRRPTAVRCCATVASAADNALLFYNPDTAQLTARKENIPNPQDFTESGLGFVATIGGIDAIAIAPESTAAAVQVIRGIPGAAGVAGYSLADLSIPASAAVVLVSSPNTNNVFNVQLTTGKPFEFRVRDTATFQGDGGAQGGLATAFAETRTAETQVAAATPLPRQLGGVRLRLGGALTYYNGSWEYSAQGATDAPLLFVGPTQVNFQIPPALGTGVEVPAELVRADGSRLVTSMVVEPLAPRLFTLLSTGQGQGAVLNQDNANNGNPAAFAGALPATRGSVIQIFGTGAGATNPLLTAGEAAPLGGNPLVRTLVQPSVSIGGQTARVLFSGLAPGFVGLWQINAEVPAAVAPGTAVPLVVTANGVPSNTVTIAVQ